MSDTSDTLEAQSVALLYDVHGNEAALDAVLDDLEGRDVDALVFGGDYALKGPRPAACIRRVRELDPPAIRGNTDEYLLNEQSSDEVVRWTRDRLADDELQWLADRPFDVRIRPHADAPTAEELLVVHATPTDIELPLLVEPHPFDGWPVTDETDARAFLGDARADLIAYGHIHVASSGRIGEQRVRSVGSIGMPWDGDQRAAYAIARWNGDGWAVEDFRVEYDWESVVEELETSDAPRAEARAESLRTAHFDPLSP